MAWSRLQSLVDFISYWKLQFYIASSMYVLDPEERIVVWAIMLAALSLLGYTIVTYLPGHVLMMISVLQDVISGSEHTTHVQPTDL